MVEFSDQLEFALLADQLDPLARFRSEFFESGEDLIYLDGNSLGKMPLRTKALLTDVINRQWGERLIRSWNTDWIGLNQKIGKQIAQLIGAKPNEVILTDSTSLNLFKLGYGSLKTQAETKNLVLSDEMNFPSDLYILQGLMDLFNSSYQLVLARSKDGITMDDQEICSMINENTALVSLSHVSFKSSFMYDMEKITRTAKSYGAHVIWDLSHATGAVPIDLNKCEVDMAVGCTYKYLNGGPGSIAFLYVREDLQDKILNPVWGWFADQKPFDFNLDFHPSNDITRFTTSTTPILSAAAVEPGLELMLEAGIDKVREKSVQLSEYMIFLFEKWLSPLGFELGSPRNPNSRGSHLSFKHPEAYRITQSLIQPLESQPTVIPDFRAPDFIRLGITPLYVGYSDVYRSLLRIREIVETKEYERHSLAREKVT